MGDFSRDLFVRFPLIPTTSGASVVLWDSGPPGQSGEVVYLNGLRPQEEMPTTHRVAGSLKTDQAWTLKIQTTFDGGTTWVDVGAGTAVLANTLSDFNLFVAGGGRRRLAAVFAGGVTPTTWLNSGQLRLIPQAPTSA